jgi:diguanylate cyclase (GGDEF)-like protein
MPYPHSGRAEELESFSDLGSWIVDVATGAVTCSTALLDVVGIARHPGTLRIGDLFTHATDDDRLRVAHAVQRAVLVEGSMSEDVCLNEGGQSRWIRVRGKVSATHPGRIVGTCQDVTEEKRREHLLAERAMRDPLTGLPNRSVFVDRLREAIDDLDGGCAGVLFIDLDRFKSVNDRYGHGVGDNLLAKVASRLARSVLPGDTVARFGGDEFAVLCASLTEPEALDRLAQRVLSAVAAPMELEGRQMRVTASIGLVHVFERTADPQTVLREADSAMYEAKQGGRDRVESFDHDSRVRRAEARLVSEEVAGAVDRGELELWFQPVVSLEDWSVVSVEALARWRHPERGVLGPAAFIPVAEADGTIVKLGAWVLREACTFAAEQSTSICVNVSAKQLSSHDFAGTVRGALRDAGLEPAQLCLEITETVLMEDIEASIDVLRELREIGVRIAIDDFGIGYSSLNYLRRLPLDIVKIDRSFTAELGDPACEAIVAAIANLSHALGLTVVAEGVESRQQLIALRALRCDHAQGYLLAWPMTREELAAWDPEAWRADAPKPDVDMGALLARRAEAFRQRTGRSIVVQAPPTMRPVAVDPETIATVVDELLANALAYSAEDLPVVVRCSTDRRYVRVSVSDWGIGMTPHDAERCWEQFFQGSRSPVNGSRGTGIGLYVVRSLIEDLGGFTAVKTSPKGNTTFTVAVPQQRRPMGAGVGESNSIQEFMKQVGLPARGVR